jgi:hypothetical protein
MIEKESLKFQELEHVLIEKVEQLFRDMPKWPSSDRRIIKIGLHRQTAIACSLNGGVKTGHWGSEKPGRFAACA